MKSIYIYIYIFLLTNPLSDKSDVLLNYTNNKEYIISNNISLIPPKLLW